MRIFLLVLTNTKCSLRVKTCFEVKLGLVSGLVLNI